MALVKLLVDKTPNLRAASRKIRVYILRECSNENRNHYDIAIAGGGMVGTTLACTLGKNFKLSNKRILLLESGKKKPWTLPEKYNNRVVSINPGTHKLLNDINAWRHINNNRFATVKRLQVWDAVSDSSITFGDETSSENVSYIVENDLLLAAANEELKDTGNVDILYGAKVKDYHLPEYHEKNVQISTEDGRKYSCDLLFVIEITQV
ncbi:hypothetical protein NQ318_004023 [Aromia moschata]|uniref:Ubiquinone biosynthesis monooxygenase COQ6 n=1 Tax=Aromia moschata TaxID=1265417 RepID=A0AAV8Z9T3_9CUCU|nr:hypothetical protein NQ318_004023 [Aromia moschata]